jgi:hypothetical protein
MIGFPFGREYEKAMGARSKTILLNLLMLVVSTTAGLGLCEIVARAVLEPPPGHMLYSKEGTEAHSALLQTVSDSRLLTHIPPNAPGHDERGFRNENGRDAADVVVIGDSQTWGINAGRSETWPSILEALSGMRVYSMALGGWGPIQYELLAHDALALKPKAILVGIYFGNDIFDSCNHAYGTDSYKRYRRPEARVAASLSDLHARLKATDDQTRVDQARDYLAQMGGAARMWQALARRSLIVRILMTRGLLPAVPSVDQLYEIVDAAWAREHPEWASLYSRGDYSTVLTFGYRGTAVDLNNACIREGVEITREVLASLKSLSLQSGVHVGAVLIPTKETVYATADQSFRRQLSGAFEELVDHENAIKRDLLSHCNRLELVCVDAASWMVEAAQNGVRLYRADSDGHPIAGGYRQIALAGLKALETTGVLKRQ